MAAVARQRYHAAERLRKLEAENRELRAELKFYFLNGALRKSLRHPPELRVGSAIQDRPCGAQSLARRCASTICSAVMSRRM